MSQSKPELGAAVDTSRTLRQKLWPACGATARTKPRFLRSLLRASGIGSRMVLISTEDGYVREDWPSPQQFNHAIAAVEVTGAVRAEGVLDSPATGRLLLFDPTDPVTPLGRLPSSEQDNLALVVVQTGGALIRTNASGPESSRWDTKAEYTLTPSGGLAAKVSQERTGDAATVILALHESGGAEKVKEVIRSYVDASAHGAHLGDLQMDFLPAASWRMTVEFESPEYAKLMQQRMIVFRPPEFVASGSRLDKSRERRLPLRLVGHSITSHSTVIVPLGFTVDEIPDPVSREAEFGTFAAAWKKDSGQLRFESRLEMRARMLPPERAGEVADFLNRVREAMRAPVVLVKK